MTTVDWNTRDIMHEILNNNWNNNNSTKPEIVINDEDEDGNPKRRRNSQKNKIIIRENNPRGMDEVGIHGDIYNKDSSVFVQIKANSSSQVNQYWKETVRIIANNKTNLKGLPGNWCRMEFENIEYDNPTTRNKEIIMVISFKAFNQGFTNSVGQ